ncbi:light-harvesting complex-like protein 3 isotype 1, chloroplastic isoform X2 [Mangifera indica]|uniref:light-harvesting complex-like protein 3 isotype 1, chloroplastic isoform X2 n=1 Tax=Mangifera indica TaxID=29780 RepID=UPI001CFBF668|nr:light-harvesting complex-like protein 3 isotype 1, chloroplastic isoform X2 [Mangifera indica]
MTTIAVSASLQRACSSNNVTKKQQSQIRTARSIGTKQKSNVVTLNVEGDVVGQQGKSSFQMGRYLEHSSETESPAPKFLDERWKNGTWDLNMFVKDGKMDWDGLIVAEARRRRFLEIYPESATNKEPVVFRSSIIPWWAWLRRTYLPEAELLNGRAAMVGFLMTYIVDALTELGVVGQTGNLVCKAGVFLTVVGVIQLRRTDDFNDLKNLADEATLYDKQWRASWQHQNSDSGNKI